MVSVIATNIKNRREYRALCELFDRTDSSGDGRVTLDEFMTACKQYGVIITEEELAGFASVAKNGEVTRNCYTLIHIDNILPLSLSQELLMLY